MELILDANILFSALLKSGLTRELMLNSELILHTPEFILSEFFKHIEELEGKTHLNKKELKELMVELLTHAKVKVIPKDELEPFMSEAKKVSPDPDDALYFAAANQLFLGPHASELLLKVLYKTWRY
ncbi:hypothetical protein K8R43_04675 [archaeon]|nr:hypothetical protein [archaeon]